MCGFAGIVGRSSADPNVLARMRNVLDHRGPDGRGYIALDGLSLAHTRLAIVDLRLGQQPLEYLNRYVIAYNGEIYNYLDLRAELEHDGYRFATATDTEVIPAAYDRWGVGCLDRFNGMWAFALYDRLSRKLLLARDRFGEKPLYWCHVAQTFVFASETKALFEHPNVQRRPNMDYCKSYLALGPQEHLEHTAFEGVYRLPSASYIETTTDELAEGRFRSRKFWSLSANPSVELFDASKAKHLADQYLDLLRSAVELRRHADVKVGATLSGGLDSSSVASLMVEGMRRDGIEDPLTTFSCVYLTQGTQHCDESVHVAGVASRLGLMANRIEPRCEDIVAEYRTMMWHMDTPPESTLMSSWHTFKSVSAGGVGVVLEGQGADEQLGGYPRYIINSIAQSRTPLRDFQALRKMESTGLFPAIGLAAHASRRLGVPNLPVRVLKAFGKSVYDGSTLNDALVRDSLTRLQTLLHYSDRTSMAYSVESRMPFLDYRLAEFLAAVPAAYKIHDGWTKYVARLAFSDRLPASTTWRRDKMGWNIPEDTWFRGPLRQWLQSEIASSKFLSELNARRPQWQLDRSEFGLTYSIRLLNLATWCRLHIERELFSIHPERTELAVWQRTRATLRNT